MDKDKDKDNYVLFFDGCSKGNPGHAGAGAVIYKNDKEIWSGSLYLGNNQTNNFAEYNGLLLGIENAIRLNIKNLLVKGDSLLVIKQINGQYKVKSESLFVIFNKIKELEKFFDKIIYQHVYRIENSKADALSNEALINYFK